MLNNAFTTIFGDTAQGSVTANGHVWTADPGTGLYSTATNLAAEWQADYSALQAGQSLNFIQHLEADAQAVFLNTSLKGVKAAQLALDRMDVQRQLDAMGQAMLNAGIDVDSSGKLTDAPINVQGYLTIEQTLQSDASLHELALQGHGLNNAGVARYNGYTNDFQNNVDKKTLYIGGGLDNNQNALTDFIDDVVLGHLPFAVVAQNGKLMQTNQNGDVEDTLTDSAGAWNFAGTKMVLTAASFATTAGAASSTPYAPPASATTAPAGQMFSLTGFLVARKLTLNGHVWTANASGLYVTNADLAGEWQSAYQTLLAGKGSTLTAAQFFEGNAEAVFENTGLAQVGADDSVQLAYDRMDAQREIDAIVGALQTAGLDPNKPLTSTTWLQMETALRNNAALEELAVQGHGLNNPPAAKYSGYTNDFQNNVDQKTLYVGKGQDSGERAIADFFDDAGMTHAAFATVVQNGQLIQLNQNGNDESTVQIQVDEYNQTRFNQVVQASDFNVPGAATPTQPAGTVTTLYGETIANRITVNGDVWTVGADGRFHTTTDLMTQWQGYYQAMLAGNGAQLTAIQRLEGNAEAVFEHTGLANLKTYSYSKQQMFREDAAREFDAIGAAMTQLGLGDKLLNGQDYLNIVATIRGNAAWQELAIQGHGLNSPPSRKYNGYTNDFQNNTDNTTYFVGGGVDTGEKAIAQFFDDVPLSHLTFPVVSQNGVLQQLNQNGNQEDTLATVTQAVNEAMFTRVFVANDFSANAKAVGDVVNVVYKTPLQTDPTPTAGAGQILSLFGQPVAASMTVNGHVWTADGAKLYRTTTDLTLEWWNSYQAAQAGQTLTLTQKWEAQAEAVFLNTGVSQQSEGQQATERMDAQRVIDAVVTVMNSLGLGGAPLTTADYLVVSKALQGNAALEQLAVEGFGLNNPYKAGVTEYLGYVNDFQWSADNSTLYFGPGPLDGERALPDFFGDAILTDLAFPVMAENGELVQLNQNGMEESTLGQAVQAVNGALFGPLLGAANFGVPGAIPAKPAATPPATIAGYYGATLPGSVTINGHLWTVDGTGAYQTSANLEMEWRADYQTMFAGRGNTLTAVQRLEGNMEAIFENTSLNTNWPGAAQEEQQRVDVQRVIDAIAAAQQTDGYDPTVEFSEASMLQLGNTIRGNAQLEELALQGLGQTSPSVPRYKGVTNDIAWADSATYFIGGDADNAKLALSTVVSDMLGNVAFEANFSDGGWQTTTANGAVGESLATAARLMNQAMYRQVFTPGDFAKIATATGPVRLIPGAQPDSVTPISSVIATAGNVVTLGGAQIASAMTVNGHVWSADAAGLFHTANLAAEWQSNYAAMAAGKGASLTLIQRDQANAEATFEAAGVSKMSAALQQELREDVQRQLDAEAAAMQAQGVSATAPLTTTTYLDMTRAMQSNAALEELALQGHGVAGVTGAAKVRYSGAIGDTMGLSQVAYIGGGINNWAQALGTYLQQNILGDAPFATGAQWGRLVQLDQTGNTALNLADQVAILNASMSTTLLPRKAFTA